MKDIAPNLSKEELLQHLAMMVALKRKEVCNDQLEAFTRVYLTSIATHKTPKFHKEMLGLLSHLGLRSSSASKSQNFSAEKITTSLDKDIQNVVSSNLSTVLTKEENSDQIILQPVDKKRHLFIAPRGFAKSSICSVAFPLWMALTGRKKDIILVSATIGLAKEMLRKIRQELETNPYIIQDYGEQKSDKWTEDYLVLKNGARILAKGRGFQIRGFRPDLIICDDLEDEEVIYSKEQREKLESWFFRTLLPTLKPDQDLIYVGTMIHESSLMSKLRLKEEFSVKFYQALTNGKSIWEELWPTETLLKLRREMGEYAFLAEYQNTPISLKEQPVKPHFIDGVVATGVPDLLCLAIDPAISEKESSDDRAFVLMARMVDDTGKVTGFKEIFSERGKWTVTEQIDKIIAIYLRYTQLFLNVPFRLVVESVAFQKIFKDDLLKEARARNIYLPVSEAELGMSRDGDGDKRPKDKFTRLMQVVHLFEQKFVQISNPDLYREILSFPLGDSDNLVDAIVYALYYLMKFRQGAYIKTQPARKLPIATKQTYALKEVRPGVFQSVIGEPEKPKARRTFFRL